MATYIPATSALTLVFVEGESSQPQPFEIIGYQVNEKGQALPVTYPAVGSLPFIVESFIG